MRYISISRITQLFRSCLSYLELWESGNDAISVVGVVVVVDIACRVNIPEVVGVGGIRRTQPIVSSLSKQILTSYYII